MPQVSGHGDDISGRVDAPLVEAYLVPIIVKYLCRRRHADSALIIDSAVLLESSPRIHCTKRSSLRPDLHAHLHLRRSASLEKRRVEPQHQFVSNWIT